MSRTQLQRRCGQQQSGSGSGSGSGCGSGSGSGCGSGSGSGSGANLTRRRHFTGQHVLGRWRHAIYVRHRLIIHGHLATCTHTAMIRQGPRTWHRRWLFLGAATLCQLSRSASAGRGQSLLGADHNSCLPPTHPMHLSHPTNANRACCCLHPVAQRPSPWHMLMQA